jgi:hypothetical protein
MPSVSVASIALLLADANSYFFIRRVCFTQAPGEEVQSLPQFEFDFRTLTRGNALRQARNLLTFPHRGATRQTKLLTERTRTRLCSHCVRKIWVNHRHLAGSSASIFSKQHTATTLNNKTETIHNMDPSNENPSSGASTLSNLSQSRSDTTKDDEPKNDTGLPSSSYAISSNGETTDLHGALALRPREGSTSTGEGKSSDEDREGQHGKSQDQPASGQDGGAGAGDEGSSGDKAMSDEHETGIKTDGTKAEPKVMKEYSNEARCYHAFYDEVGCEHT